MIRHPLLVAALLLPILTAGPAAADAIRFTSADDFGNSVGYFRTRHVRFEGTRGTFEPGSTIGIGHIVVADDPATLPFTALDGSEFALNVRTPDFDRIVTGGSGTATYQETSYSGIVVRGHLMGHVGGGVAPDVTAVFDRIDVGLIMPVTHRTPPYTFPLPLADVKLPASVSLIGPARPGREGVAYASGEVLVQITPEPATLAVWALVGSAALVVRRHRRPRPRINSVAG